MEIGTTQEIQSFSFHFEAIQSSNYTNFKPTGNSACLDNIFTNFRTYTFSGVTEFSDHSIVWFSIKLNGQEGSTIAIIVQFLKQGQ